MELTAEGRQMLEHGSHEYVVFSRVAEAEKSGDIGGLIKTSVVDKQVNYVFRM